MLSILVSNDWVQNNQLNFILNSPDLVEKQKALSLLDIFPQENKIIIKIIMESSAKGRKYHSASLPPPKLKTHINFSPAPGIISHKESRKFGFKTQGASQYDKGVFFLLEKVIKNKCNEGFMNSSEALIVTLQSLLIPSRKVR